MFQLPITQEQIRDLTGKTLAICRNTHGNTEFVRIGERTLISPGIFRGGRVSAESGALCIYDKNGLWAKFDSIEFNGSSSYMRGSLVREYNGLGNDNHLITLHVKKELGNEPFGICISSCREYADTTMPKILKSLAGAKIPGDRIRVVIGGHQEDSEEIIGNIQVLNRIENGEGFNGLMAVTDEFKYWLLLHDTSTVELDLVDRIREIDVGLCPDLVRAAPKSSLGLYSTSFILRVKEQFNGGIEPVVLGNLNTCVTVDGEEKVEPRRDIYGKGVRRSTRTMPIGIVKYDAKTLYRRP